MSRLRTFVLTLGALLLATAILVAVVRGPIGIILDLGVGGIIIIAGVLLERGRYQPQTTGHPDDWELTPEKFVDDTTGKTMRVRFNRRTGERSYIEDDTSR